MISSFRRFFLSLKQRERFSFCTRHPPPAFSVRACASIQHVTTAMSEGISRCCGNQCSVTEAPVKNRRGQCPPVVFLGGVLTANFNDLVFVNAFAKMAQNHRVSLIILTHDEEVATEICDCSPSAFPCLVSAILYVSRSCRL